MGVALQRCWRFSNHVVYQTRNSMVRGDLHWLYGRGPCLCRRDYVLSVSRVLCSPGTAGKRRQTPSALLPRRLHLFQFSYSLRACFSSSMDFYANTISPQLLSSPLKSQSPQVPLSDGKYLKGDKEFFSRSLACHRTCSKYRAPHAIVSPSSSTKSAPDTPNISVTVPCATSTNTHNRFTLWQHIECLHGHAPE